MEQLRTTIRAAEGQCLEIIIEMGLSWSWRRRSVAFRWNGLRPPKDDVTAAQRQREGGFASVHESMQPHIPHSGVLQNTWGNHLQGFSSGEKRHVKATWGLGNVEERF